MNDDQLKKLIQSDQSEPKIPKDEWEKIESKMQLKTKSKNLFSRYAFALSVLVVVLVSVNKNYNQEISDQELASFLFEEDSSELEPLYSWID